MSQSSIEWTEQTWNPIAGCSVVSPGCTHCYAMTMAARLEAMGQAKYVGLTKKVNGHAVWTGKLTLSEADLPIPLKRKKPTVWFVNSMSDLFHEDVPFDFIDKVFAVMALCPQHTFQVLTKRPARMAEYLTDSHKAASRSFKVDFLAARRFDEMHGEGACLRGMGEWHWPLRNVWLGTSVEDQARADERIPELLKCPAAVRFLSCEPLLGPINFSPVAPTAYKILSRFYRKEAFDEAGKQPTAERMEGLFPPINWVIVGGESGPHARPCYVNWIDSIRDQCAAAGVACFVKQLGANVRCETEQEGDVPIDLKDKKGGDPSEWPADLRIRQMPSEATIPA